MLYIVSTPIGNLEDMTYRAVRTLKEVSLIAAEDTRHAKILLNHYGISTPMISYHSHSNQDKVDKIVEMLKEGQDIALISDAGTPGISDPAYTLIQGAIEAGVQIVPIPGPSSLLSAMVASGLPMNQFLYLGFLPLKKGRQKLLTALQEEPRTMVIFESPHRIQKTLAQLKEFWGDREVAVARELTKIHEEVRRGPLSTMIEHFNKTKPRGEFVLVVAGTSWRKKDLEFLSDLDQEQE